MHANAWVDPYFQADNAFDGYQQICLNCHTPLRNQQKNFVLGFRDQNKFIPILKPNPDFDASLQLEGVTCAACHVRDGAIIGPFGSDAAPHPVRKDERMRDGYSPCIRCHMVTGKRWDTFYRFPPCGTYDETQESGRAPECMECHMPSVKRAIIPDGDLKDARHHLWRGGHDHEMVKKGLKIKLEGDATTDKVTLLITNSWSNHRIPTGPPDRHLTVTFRLLDEDQKTLKKKTWKMKRTIMWRPFIVDIWDTRLKAGETRSFPFSIKGNKKAALLDVEVRYHLLDEKRRKRISYKNSEPIDYRIFFERVDLGG